MTELVAPASRRLSRGRPRPRTGPGKKPASFAAPPAVAAGRRHHSPPDGRATKFHADSRPPMYVELHAPSAFSLLEGASLPEELAAVGSQLKLPAMALLDTDGVYGAPRFHLAAKKMEIKAHIGA